MSGRSGKCLRTEYSIIASSAATTNAVREVNTKSRTASSVSIAVSGKQRSRSSIRTTSCSTPALVRRSSNDLRKALISSGTFLDSPSFSLSNSLIPPSAFSAFSFVASWLGLESTPLIVPRIAWIWSGVGTPVKAVKANPPAFLATFSQSIRRRTSLTASPALVRVGRFSIRPVTMPSISAIFASSKP